MLKVDFVSLFQKQENKCISLFVIFLYLLLLTFFRPAIKLGSDQAFSGNLCGHFCPSHCYKTSIKIKKGNLSPESCERL